MTIDTDWAKQGSALTLESTLGFGAIGTSGTTAPSPTLSGNVAGLGNTFVGVQGLSHTTYGVYGQSDSAAGVRGEIPPTSSANAIAIFGVNNSSFARGGPGGGGFGLYGVSAKGHGLVGAAATAGAAAVVGATNGVAGAYAAAFYGPVLVGGNFTVIGGAKSAAVPHPDGTLRRLYCLESPESWFEDFGRANLECGAADVGLDPSFAALVDTSDYHVFLTAHGADLLLHVADRTERGFTVLADAEFARMKGRRAEDLSGSFSWRVVARRKDIPGERLSVVTVPPEPQLPSLDHPPQKKEPTR